MRRQFLLLTIIFFVHLLLPSARPSSLEAERPRHNIFAKVNQWFRSRFSRPDVASLQRDINMKLGREKDANSYGIITFLTRKVKIKRVVAIILNLPANQQNVYLLLNDWKTDNELELRIDYYSKKDLSGIKKRFLSKRRTLVIGCDVSVLREAFRLGYPVAVMDLRSKPLKLRSVPIRTQLQLNEFVTEGQKILQLSENEETTGRKRGGETEFKASDLVVFFVQSGVKVVALEFEQTATAWTTLGFMPPRATAEISWKKIFTLTPGFLEFANECEEANLQLIIVSSTTDEEAPWHILQYSGLSREFNWHHFGVKSFESPDPFPEFQKKCKGGTPLIRKILDHYKLENVPICAFNEIYRKNARTGKTDHLELIRQKGYLDPREIVLVDHNRENLDQAVREGYLAIGVNPSKGFDLATLEIVEPPEGPDDPIVPAWDLTIPSIPVAKERLRPLPALLPQPVQRVVSQRIPRHTETNTDYLTIQHQVNFYLKDKAKIDDGLGEEITRIIPSLRQVILLTPPGDDRDNASLALEKSFERYTVQVYGLEDLHQDKFKALQTLLIVSDIEDQRQNQEIKGYPLAVIDLTKMLLRSFPILEREQLAKFIDGLREKDKQADRLYAFLTIKGVKGFAFNFDGTATAEVTGGFMPPLKFEEEEKGSWKRIRPTNDFKAIAKLIAKDGVPFYILTFSDPMSLEEVEDKSDLQKKKGYFKHHFGKRMYKTGMKIEDFKAGCLVGEELVRYILNRDGVYPQRVIAWNPRSKLRKQQFWEEYEEKTPKLKAYHLQRMAEETGLHPKEIILFDDDERNVLRARKDGYFAVYVGGYNGFQFKELTCRREEKPRKPKANIKKLRFKRRACKKDIGGD